MRIPVISDLHIGADESSPTGFGEFLGHLEREHAEIILLEDVFECYIPALPVVSRENRVVDGAEAVCDIAMEPTRRSYCASALTTWPCGGRAAFRRKRNARTI